MATLFLLCGLPGSGKTTLAKRLEKSEHALRLCPDEWIAKILVDPADTAEMDRLREIVESIQWEAGKRALTLGINVVLENGFWSREERSRFRAEAEAIGVRVQLHYLKADINELWRRLSARNVNLPLGTFVVRREDLESWAKLFEPPTEDELS
ncbi:MAG: ATP-binding protein [Anaerolineales bacterium]|nr:ATP-binding protein [Anaerolineales bacterium]